MILFAGEGEGRLAGLLRDIDAGAAQKLYNFLDDMPDMAAAAIPVLPRPVVTRINVQGRKSRYRTADDVEAIVRANAAQGITRFFVTDETRHVQSFPTNAQFGSNFCVRRAFQERPVLCRFLCRFLDAGITRGASCSGGRRPKSAKARSRGKVWGRVGSQRYGNLIFASIMTVGAKLAPGDLDRVRKGSWKRAMGISVAA